MSFKNATGDYYSNCMIEAIRAKIKWKNQIKIIFLPPWKNDAFCCHFMWHDLADNNLKDFHNVTYMPHWWSNICFKGYIRVRPYSVYKNWLKTKEW